MCERRVLILAVVTDIHDSTVTYPSCCGCYSKLLVDPTTDRYHCIRCGVSCDRTKVQWRYRLVLSVADGTTIGRVVVFGRTLDGFFGKTATDFSRSLDDLERTGYPTSSMLSEALLRTFHGKYFYFGFKLTGSSDAEETPALKDILKSENSLCYSQLDCTSNFENSHTLAYQMLACSDAVYATVTDHMRLLVKHLRNQNQSKTFKTPDCNQSWKVSKEAQSIKNLSSRTAGSLSSCRTVSFGADQESLKFSFETDENRSVSFQETERFNRSKISLSKNYQHVTECSENDKSPFVTHEEDLRNKEMFLTGSGVNPDDLQRCVTFDTINEENEESCFPLVGNGSAAFSILQSNNQNFIRVGNFASFVGSFNADTFSDILVAHRLDFDNLNESDTSNTSRKIDNELVRRKLVSSQKNMCCKTASSSDFLRVPDKESCWDENRLKTKCENDLTVDEHLTDITVETDCNDAIISKSKLKNCENVTDRIVDSGLKRKHDCYIIDELRMPESEDLDAFFESGFEGIQFTQDVHVESNTGEKDGDEYFTNMINKKSKGILVENLDLDKFDTKNKEIDSDRVKNKQCPIMARVEGINMKEDVTIDFPCLPESEQIEDFLDSFEECLLQEEELAAQSRVKVKTVPENTQSEKYDGDEKENVTDRCTEVDKELTDIEAPNTGKTAATLGNIAEECKLTKEVGMVANDNIVNELKGEEVDDFLLDREADLHEEEEFFSTLSFAENDNEGTKYGLDDIENEGINECGFNFNDASTNNASVELKLEPSSIILLGKDNSAKSTHSDLDKVQSDLGYEGNEFIDSTAESMSEDGKNESSDLEQFLADISNNEGQIPEMREEIFRPVDSSLKNKQANELPKENDMEKMRTEKITADLVEVTEDTESDLDEFFHDLSQLCLKESGKDSCINIIEIGNENVNSKTDSNANNVTKRKMTANPVIENEINQNEENCSIIDKSSDFEATNVKLGKIKPVFRLVPFSNRLRVGNTSQRTVKTVTELNADSSKLEHTRSDTAKESNAIETVITFNEVNASNTGSVQKVKNTSGTLETPTEKRECKDSRYESSSINYSADLFEMSGGESEQGSAYVLTVCTPSFNTKLNSENSSLNEDAFEDSPLGTSTPGLDECVIFDSQDMSDVYESQSKNNLANQGDAKRKVKFDKRLRRVSSCHVLDIRMRLNESPLNMPVLAVKSCLKSRKLSSKYVAENSVVEESRNNSHNVEANADFDKRISEDQNGCIVASSTLNGNNVEQTSVCLELDGSSDLFGESLVISPKEPLILTDHKGKHEEQKTGEAETVRAYNLETVRTYNVKENVTREDKKNITPCMPNSQDLWLNESTDSFMYEAILGNKHSQNPNDMQNNDEKVYASDFTTANSETPDIFASQQNFMKFPTYSKGSKNDCSESCKLPEYQINKDPLLQFVGKVGEISQRKALKCLVINTPDCDTDILSKQRAMCLKFQDHSSETGVHHGYQQSLNEMKENICVDDSPDIFGDSLEELDRKLICDKKNVVNKSSVLCKKLFF